MKLLTSGNLKLFSLAVCVFTIMSCKKTFDVLPQTSIDQTQAYRNVNDADAAVIGIYAKVLRLAKQYELWNELRGDLMDITVNADKYLRQLSEHTVTADNPYINPQPFYDVILNCNDAMYNFTIMLQQSKFKTDEFNQRYSDIAAIRSWVYLQLAIHFGNIPYVTQPLTTVADLHDATKFPILPFKQVLDSITAFTEALPFLSDYPAGTNLQTTVDGYPTSKFFINKNMLLGDLYLWEGQYDKAADRFNRVMNINGNAPVPAGAGVQYYDQYRISNQANMGINYSRAQDFSTLNYTNGWRDIFERGFTEQKFRDEWIWVIPFDAKFAPTDPFIDLFSPIGGSYLVQPSQQAIDNWNSQTQVITVAGSSGSLGPPVVAPTPNTYIDNFPFDSRGFPFTYKYIGGQPVIMKFLYNYLSAGTADATNLPLNILAEQGKWFLERAATLHLHYAEAANRAGHPFLAYALVNYGITYHYDPYHSNGQSRDARNIEQTFLPDPYNFDGRVDAAPFTNFRQPWYRNAGIRGRAGVKQVVLPTTDSITNVENMIINEDALELAYEGERWPDLLRVAMRRNDPSFIADKIYDKLRKSGLSAGAAGAARAKLLSKDWFFPFKW